MMPARVRERCVACRRREPQGLRSTALLRYRLRRAARYVDRILKATKPSDLPIELPIPFALIVNLKTAKALGLTMPPEIMVRADRLIE